MVSVPPSSWAFWRARSSAARTNVMESSGSLTRSRILPRSIHICLAPQCDDVLNYLLEQKIPIRGRYNKHRYDKTGWFTLFGRGGLRRGFAPTKTSQVYGGGRGETWRRARSGLAEQPEIQHCPVSEETTRLYLAPDVRSRIGESATVWSVADRPGSTASGRSQGDPRKGSGGQGGTKQASTAF